MGEMKLFEYGSRDAWIAGRRDGIGASEVSILFGLAPASWGSPYTLFLEKTGRLEKELDQGDEPEWLEMGRRMEPVVADVYEDRTKRKLWKGGGAHVVAVDPELSVLRATPDRFVLELPEESERAWFPGNGVLEIKNVGFYRAHDWDEGTPPHVECQVQAQLACTGLLWGSAAGILGGNRFVYRDIKRNDVFIAEMRTAVEEFWALVKSGTPPDIDGSAETERAIKRLNPRDSGDEVGLPPESVIWWETIEQHKAAIKAAEDEHKAPLKEAENNLRAAIGSATYGVLPDGRRLTLFTTDRGGYSVEPTSYRTLKLESLKAKKGRK